MFHVQDSEKSEEEPSGRRTDTCTQPEGHADSTQSDQQEEQEALLTDQQEILSRIVMKCEVGT